MRYLTYRPASNVKRLIAYLIDIIPIHFGLYAISMSFFGVSPMSDFLSRPEDHLASVRAKLLIDLCGMGIWIIYCVAGEMSPWRGTYGKKVMGLVVCSVTGRRLTFRQSLGRNTAKILSAIPLYAGFIAAFFVYGNRAWHDSLSGTAVTDRK